MTLSAGSLSGWSDAMDRFVVVIVTRTLRLLSVDRNKIFIEIGTDLDYTSPKFSNIAPFVTKESRYFPDFRSARDPMAEGKSYQFRDCELDLSRNCLLKDGQEVHLRQKARQVLIELIEGGGRLITKDELFAKVWPDTAVTDDVLVQAVKELRRTLGDDPHNPQFIKTIPKSGYRFICDINDANGRNFTEEITKVEVEIEEETHSESFIGSERFYFLSQLDLRKVFWGGAAAMLVILTAVVFFGAFSTRETENVKPPAIAGKTVLAVMFFANRTGDPEIDWLREGLADMLITNLSRSRKVATLSRGQLQVLLERSGHDDGAAIGPAPAMEIARSAGVDTLLMGDFARIGEKIRVNATLLDAGSGDLKAAESITVDSAEQLLREIDLLSLMLVRRLDSSGEGDSAAITTSMTDNLEAYRYYSLALEKAQGLNKAEAIKLFEKAIALDPDFAMAHARLGHTYAVTWGLVEKARPHLAKAFELSDRLTGKDRLYIMAWFAIANLDYPGAVTHFQQIIDEYPLETEAYLRLGNLLRGERRPVDAINVLKRGLIIDPESPVIHNTLGLIYSEGGNHDDAIAMHNKYVSLAPNEANAYDSLGMSLQWAGRYDEAISAYSRALELSPRFEIAICHLGVTYFQTGQYQKAVEYIERYLKESPSDLERGRAYSYLARIAAATGDKKKALAFAQQAIKSGDHFAWELLALTIEKNDRRAVSEISYKLFSPIKVSNRGSRVTDRPLFYYQAMVALSGGQADKAIERLKASLEQNPYTWDIDSFEDALGRTYLKLGRYEEAISEFERVLRLNPNYPLAHFHLAEAYRMKGSPNEAADNYRSFLDVWKNADSDIPELIAARRYLGI